MDQVIIAFASLVVTFAISASLTAWLSRSPPLFCRMLDVPNERSLHARTVPRTGGIAVVAAFLCGTGLALAMVFLVLPHAFAWSPISHLDWAQVGRVSSRLESTLPSLTGYVAIAGALLMIGAVSLLDDCGHVDVKHRLASHLGAAIVLCAGGITWSEVELPGFHWVLPHGLSWVLTSMYLVWMVNLYNFMDGMDGFAGGMAVFGFGTLALLGVQGGDPAFALANALVAAAAGGFLVFNFSPARIFLGDLGSTTLGLLAGIATLVGAGRGLFPLWVGCLAFSPFIVDATWTLLWRLCRGEAVWEAHRSHHFQLLVLAGWSHRKTALWSYVIMAACLVTAVQAPNLDPHDQWILVGGWAVLYLLIGFRIRTTGRESRLVTT